MNDKHDITVGDIFEWLDAIAPFETQDEYDNAGLLVGDPSAQVRKILFALDVTRSAAAEAARIGADLIIFPPSADVSTHPAESAGNRAKARSFVRLPPSGVGLIAAHTNWDQCQGGVADALAETLGLTGSKPCEQNPYLRTGDLANPCTAKEFLALINQRLNACTRLYGDPDALIRSVAVVPGAGGETHVHVDADAFVTGEIKHHELLGAIDRGLIVLDAGHHPTEFPGIAALYRRFLKAASDNGWAVEATLYSRPPIPCSTHG